jgi:sugar diacid utilization regulator
MNDTRVAEETANRDAVVSLLKLLASEAPLSMLQDFAERTSACLGSGEVDAWRQASGLVVRLWEMLRESKHREQEMLALFDTASDLTSSLQDTDQLLNRIVQRARERFATDSCYLVLTYPETGEARMRVTAGSSGFSIRQAHLPWGWGLVGVMKRSGRPYFSTNYLGDPNLMHDPDVDAAAVDEGIVSIAGAPLRLGEEMLGALFVATRHERTFTEAELNLLGSLANHAAIVLQKARLFEGMRSALNELQAANREIEKHVTALERASSMHEQLTRLVLTGANLAELARVVTEALGGDLVLADAESRVQACSTPERAEELAGEIAREVQRSARVELAQLVAELGSADTAAATQVVSAPGGARSVWVAPVRAAAETFGALVLSTPRDLEQADVRTLERSAQTAAALILIERSMSLAEEQVRGDFVDDLLGERPPDWAAVERRARRLGIDFAQPHVLLVASCASDYRRRLADVARAYARDRGGIMGERLGYPIVILPGSESAAAARMASADLARGVRVPVTVGSAGPVASLTSLRDAHRDAAQCHRVLLALGRIGEGAAFDDLGMFGVLLETSTGARLRGFVASTLGPLEVYDEENGTQLLETLEAYFASRGNPRVAAKDLHVHTNTVYQRLERIEALLLPAEWRSPETSLELQLALKLRRILAHEQGVPR